LAIRACSVGERVGVVADSLVELGLAAEEARSAALIYDSDRATFLGRTGPWFEERGRRILAGAA
jgi:hypothetical protein